ncbi:unnamed protein product [Candida verbasci]|uniref:Zn(2)-C6 fungal-type domain-containing protein n=1 Tax=Candida verbasci TaxID=1227364 RepID=A0A9W4TX12_9ASCO|nr:unnamed protein product [Candida verbasci]
MSDSTLSSPNSSQQPLPNQSSQPIAIPPVTTSPPPNNATTTNPALKRKRVRQACDFCRSKKAKCDGISPTCSNCLNNNEKCIYTQPIKRRGLPTGYTHDLERKVLLFQSILGNIVLDKQVEKTILALLNDSSFLQNIQESQQIWKNSSVSNQVAKLVSGKSNLQNLKSSLNNQKDAKTENTVKEEIPQPMSIDSMLDNVGNFTNDPSFFLNYDIFQFVSDDIEINLRNDTTWEPVALQYHGLSSIISCFTNKAVQQYNNKLVNKYKNPFRVGSIFNISSFAVKARLTDKIQLPTEIFQFPSNTRKLVDNYFQIYHCWLPMLDRISIIRQLHNLRSLNNHHQKIDCNLIALVWAILALGESAASNGNFNVNLVTTYAENSILALENSLTSTIETIQAMILLGFFYYQLGQWDFSWILISSGSRMAIDVRLMRSAKNETTSNDLNSCSTLNNISRERTWATVYFVNTALSARMGRTPVVRASDWPIPKINIEGWEEWESWQCFHNPKIQVENGRFLSTFNESLKGVHLLNLAITSTLDPSEGMTNDDSSSSDSDLNDIRKNSNKLTMATFKKKLKDWIMNLPNHCKLENYSMDLVPPAILCLHCIRELIWCILAIRLSSISNDAKVMKSRNQQYTKSVLKIKQLFNLDNMVYFVNYPFIDYVITISLTFPEMLDFDSEFEKMKYCKEMKQIFQQAKLKSIPCRISYELFEIMNLNENNETKAQESPTIANLLNSPTIKEKNHEEEEQQQHQQQQQPAEANNTQLQPPIPPPIHLQSPSMPHYVPQQQHQHRPQPQPHLNHYQQHSSPQQPFINHSQVPSQLPRNGH